MPIRFFFVNISGSNLMCDDLHFEGVFTLQFIVTKKYILFYINLDQYFYGW